MSRGQRAGLDIPPERADPLDHVECREVARHRRPGRHARARQDRRRRGLEPRSVQRVCAARPRLHRRRTGIRPEPSARHAPLRLPARPARSRTMNRRRTLALVALLASCLGSSGIAHAQDVLIRGAKVHTLTAKGTLERADVLVRGGRVVEVGSGLAATAGATVVEANGRPLTPGLFGGITGLGIVEIELESSTVDRSALVGDGASGPAFVPRPEFDVAPAFQSGLRVDRRQPQRRHHVRDDRPECVGHLVCRPGGRGASRRQRRSLRGRKPHAVPRPGVLCHRRCRLQPRRAIHVAGAGSARGAAWQAAAGWRRATAHAHWTRSAGRLPRRWAHCVRRRPCGRHPTGARLRCQARRAVP